MGHSSYVYSYRDNSEILKNTESREYPKTDQNHNELFCVVWHALLIQRKTKWFILVMIIAFGIITRILQNLSNVFQCFV